MERYARTWLETAQLDAELRLPGIGPLSEDDWLHRDEAFAFQMSERDRLIHERRTDVISLLPAGEDAAQECLSLVLESIRRDGRYRHDADVVTRPDGKPVRVDHDDPLGTAGRLIQSDLCILQPGSDGHVLTGAVLCFPASWTLSQKIGKPLVPIHAPVAEYDDELSRRVQRLFDAIRVGQPLQRRNALLYVSDRLFHPLTEGTPHERPRGKEGFLRSERQTLRRLSRTGAVIFGIHTRIVPASELPASVLHRMQSRYEG